MVSSEGGGGPSGGGVDALSTRLNATFSKEPVAVPKGSQIETCSWLEEFFNFVSAAGVSAKLECAIPDTIVFKYHRPMTWYYWEEVTPAPSRPALDGTAHGGDACASSGALGASLRTAHACRSTSPQRRVAGLGGGAAAPAPGAAPGIVNQGVASGAAFAGGGADALSILAAPASGDGARAPDSCGGGGADGGGGGNTAERFGAASRPPSIAAPVALAAANAAAAAIAADPPPFRIGALVRHPDSVLALTAKEIHQGFCAPVDSAGRRHHSDLVAYYVRTAKDEYGSPVPTIEYFDEVGLRDFLYHREATDNGFLQRCAARRGYARQRAVCGDATPVVRAALSRAARSRFSAAPCAKPPPSPPPPLAFRARPPAQVHRPARRDEQLDPRAVDGACARRAHLQEPPPVPRAAARAARARVYVRRRGDVQVAGAAAAALTLRPRASRAHQPAQVRPAPRPD